jgi:hypothetical protein
VTQRPPTQNTATGKAILTPRPRTTLLSFRPHALPLWHESSAEHIKCHYGLFCTYPHEQVLWNWDKARVLITTPNSSSEPPLSMWSGQTVWFQLFTSNKITVVMWHVPVLRLIRSDLALALVSRTNLSLRELDLCSIYTKQAFVESFLQNNAKSLRSLKSHDITVEDRDRRDSCT